MQSHYTRTNPQDNSFSEMKLMHSSILNNRQNNLNKQYELHIILAGYTIYNKTHCLIIEC